MKKVGILTFTYGDNFGQRLQNLAVQEVLKNLGFEVFTIPQILPRNYHPINESRHLFFKKFDAKYIQYYSESIGKYKVPKGLNAFSFFVTGSDQVWSPYSSDVNSSFFLRFAPKEKRITFAPSIAAEEIPLKKRLKYWIYFNGFKEISVREEKAAELVRQYTPVPVITLVDPTLMFDISFWNNYAEKPNYNIPSNYILYYGLGCEDEYYKIESVANEMNCEIITLRAGRKEFNIGPSEFLYLIAKAKCVFTDSFHGTIFSILYNKPFVYLHRKQNNLNMSSRFDTLFYKLKIDVHSIDKIDSSIIDRINYIDIQKNIEIERELVWRYLKNCFML